jgi:hypothetical protein
MVHLSPFRAGYSLCVSTDFLDRLASQLRANKSAACRRAIQRILAIVKTKMANIRTMLKRRPTSGT